MRSLFFSILFAMCLASAPAPLLADAGPLQLVPRIEVMPPAVDFSPDIRAWLQAHRTITVGIWGASQPPVSLGIERGQLAGVDADYLALLESTLNVRFNLVHYRDSEAALKALNQGKITLLAIWNPALWPHKNVQASVPWLMDRSVSVTAKDLKLQLIEVESGLINLLHERSVPEALEGSPRFFQDDYHALNSIAFGQANQLWINHSTARYLTRSNNIDNVWLLPHPAPGNLNLSFGVGKGSPHLLSAIDQVLHALPLVSRLRIAHGWGLDNEHVVGQHPLPLTEQEQKWLNAHTPVTVLLDSRRLPFSFVDQHGKPEGLAVEVLQRLGDRYDLKFAFKIADNDEQMATLLLSNPDALVANELSAPGENEASQPTLKLSDAWLISPAVLMMSRTAARPLSFHELNGEKVAIEKRNPLIPWLETWYPTLQVVPVDSINQAMDQLEDSKVHAVIATQFAAQYELKQRANKTLYQALAVPAKPLNVSFAVRGDNPLALSIINKAIRETPPETLNTLVNHWQETMRIDTSSHTESGSLLMAFLPGLGAVLLLLVSALWISKLHQSLKNVINRLNRYQLLVDQLQAAKAETDRVLAARNAFMKSMGHEVRTPLNAIVGLLELELQLQDEKGRSNTNIQTAWESACTLQSTIGDVFDIFHAEMRDDRGEVRTVNLLSLLQSTVALYRQQAEEKGQIISLSTSLLHPQVESNPLLIIRIVSSLLRNAIKHSAEGEIGVNIRQETGDINGNLPLVIEVCDSGEGMPDFIGMRTQARPAEEPGDRVWADTGFSLAACQRMAKNAGGSLQIAGSPGTGSAVSLHLLVQPTRERKELPHPPPAEANSVLVVDDYPPARLLLDQQLKKNGHRVFHASHGLEGLTVWQQHRSEIGLIITDCTMPEMDGFEMTRRIRQQEAAEGSTLPIVGLTAVSRFDALDKCLQAGMEECLSKPLDSAALRQLLSRYFN